jgi:hypothetical protein
VIVATVYDSIIMVSTKLLKHRLSLERLIEAKREESRVTRAVLSRVHLPMQAHSPAAGH